MKRTHGRTLVLGFGVLAGLLGAPAPVLGADRGEEGAKWIRLVEDPDTTLHMDVGMREYAHESGEGPTVTLVGAVHIGARPYYRGLQRLLDEEFDLVLYEGVNPEGTSGGEDLNEGERRELTKNRLRLVAMLLERAKMEDGAYPESLDALAASLEGKSRPSAWLEIARRDAWGHVLDYRRSGDGFRLMSMGADGEPGGSRAGRDMDFAEQRALSDAELGVEPGLQARLAKTFRLTFQLDEMREDGEHWVNSDMSIDEINRRVEAAGGDGSMLFSMLDGSGGMMKMAGAVLSLVEALPGAPQRGQLMIMELLSNVDELENMPGMPGGQALMRVIIEDRNQVVIEDLREVLHREAPPARIAVLYGAGHMPDLVERMEEQLGYVASGPMEWNTSMRLNLERAGIAKMEHMMLRAEILRQLEAAQNAPAE